MSKITDYHSKEYISAKVAELNECRRANGLLLLQPGYRNCKHCGEEFYASDVKSERHCYTCRYLKSVKQGSNKLW